VTSHDQQPALLSPADGGVRVPLPFLHGRYDVAPGMARLAAPAPAGGNEGFFVVGPDACAYLAEKLRVLEAHADWHRGAMASADEAALARILWGTLLTLGAEHPSVLATAPDGAALVSPPLGLRYELAGPPRSPELLVRRIGSPAAGWEELARAVERWLHAATGLARLADCAAHSMQEDYAAVRDDGREGDERGDAVEYVHVSFPSHWDPREKLGQHFSAVHAPVANNETLLKAHRNIVRAMIAKGPFVRHAWGIARDAELDHHPAAVAERAAFPHSDRSPEPADLRVERQTTRGFAGLGRAVFTIRTYIVPFTVVRQDPTTSRALAAALRGMSDATREYKGLAGDCDALAEWLEGG
jgi:hypothetical protein